MRRIFLIMCIALIALADKYNVLFLGNSYTASNNLPALVTELALSGGDTVVTASNTPGGYTLLEHSSNTTSMDLIASGLYDYVVLQDQSQAPVIPTIVEPYTVTGASNLDYQIESECAQTVFFMTWGREFGGRQCWGDDCSPDFVDFNHMQDSLRSTYTRVAEELNAHCAPVGESWRLAHAINPSMSLWTSDHSHPAIYGSYLAACTIYSTITGKRTAEYSYISSISTDDAAFLREVSDSVVFGPSEYTWRTDGNVTNADFEYSTDDGVVEFYNLSTNAYGYIWDFGDGSVSTDENPVHTYEEDGVFPVMLIASSPCFTDTMYDTLSVSLSIIEEIALLDEEFKIYPNPTSSYLKIDLREIQFDISSVEIIDILGNVIYRNYIMSKSILNIDLSQYRQGIYLLKINCPKEKLYKKIIIN